jgi:hypothetical protein
MLASLQKQVMTFAADAVQRGQSQPVWYALAFTV